MESEILLEKIFPGIISIGTHRAVEIDLCDDESNFLSLFFLLKNLRFRPRGLTQIDARVEVPTFHLCEILDVDFFLVTDCLLDHELAVLICDL